MTLLTIASRRDAEALLAKPHTFTHLLSFSGAMDSEGPCAGFDTFAADRRLHRAFDDVSNPQYATEAERQGYVLPSEDDVHAIIAFARTLPTRFELLAHCHAGISRSTAAAYIALVVWLDTERGPERAAMALVRGVRPQAQPNMIMVTHADRLLGKGGRLLREVERG